MNKEGKWRKRKRKQRKVRKEKPEQGGGEGRNLGRRRVTIAD